MTVTVTVNEELKHLAPPVKGMHKMAVSLEIERIFHSCTEKTYLEACLEFAEIYGYDIDVLPKLISPTLKHKIESEAINNNQLKEPRSSNTLSKWA